MDCPIVSPIEPGTRNIRGFTVLELLTTLAFLVIVLGVLVSLARYVRATSAQDVTRRTLAELDDAYQMIYSPRIDTRPTTLPSVEPPAPSVDEAQFQVYVQRVSVPIVRQLLQQARVRKAAGQGGEVAPAVGLQPAGETEQVVRDAWGNPIALLLSQHPGIGMAPQNRPFFVSAGPDGRYLTREDNLYSYEVLRPTAAPQRVPAGGHGE